MVERNLALEVTHQVILAEQEPHPPLMETNPHLVVVVLVILETVRQEVARRLRLLVVTVALAVVVAEALAVKALAVLVALVFFIFTTRRIYVLCLD
jgi:hypothetical protein